MLLLGLKARRDFHVYDWPFRQHGFKVPWRSLCTPCLRASVSRYAPLARCSRPLPGVVARDAAAALRLPRQGGSEQEPQLGRPAGPRLGAAVQRGAVPTTVAAAGVVACHSIFTHNCLRVHTPAERGTSTAQGNDQANDQALLYALLPRRQKINRIAFARKVRPAPLHQPTSTSPPLAVTVSLTRTLSLTLIRGPISLISSPWPQRQRNARPESSRSLPPPP